MTDARLRDGVRRALRRLTQGQPPACQVDSIPALIRRGARRLARPRPSALRLTPASRGSTPVFFREAGEAELPAAVGLPLPAVAGRLVG